MLNNHHRAVYRFHHRRTKQIADERRVYYIVTEFAPNTFRVTLLGCCPTASLSPLPSSEAANALCFTAKGNDIDPLPEKCGRYHKDQPHYDATVELQETH